MLRTGRQANGGNEPSAVEERGARSRPKAELVGLIRKLRWLREEREAEKLEHELHNSTRLDTKDPALYETD
jgi:hypothetical protein